MIAREELESLIGCIKRSAEIFECDLIPEDRIVADGANQSEIDALSRKPGKPLPEDFIEFLEITKEID
ncbi:MAG: hypothetical protein QM496_10640 [Verrucomicrobiota bacterium]